MNTNQNVIYIVSACLAGEKCRYDGNSNTVNSIKEMVTKGTALPVCPEMIGGLSVPRVRCELSKNNDGSFEITGEDGNSYTDAFRKGAMLSLDIALKKGITKAVLKSKSPSCGCGLIYDGTFTRKLVEGNGAAADLFLKSGIEILTEIEFENVQTDIKTST